jgi:Tol biopolymer transport system component
MQNHNLSLRICVLFIVLSLFADGCNKKPVTNDLPEVINYDNLNGTMAFSRSDGKIIILNGDKKTATSLIINNNGSSVDASVSLSADGENISYSAFTNEGYQIFKVSSDGSNNLKLTKSTSGFVEHYMCPVWSADGRNIFYVKNGWILLGPVYSINPDGTNLKQITDFEVYRRVSVSKDNSFIVYSAPPAPYVSQIGIYLYIIRDKSIKQIKTYDNSLIAYSPALSPDEKKVAFLLRHGPNEPGTSPYFIRIMTINIDGTDEILVKELIESNATESFVTWSPDGTKLAYNYGGGVLGDQGSHIFIINSDGTGLTQVTNNTDYDGAPSWIK